MIAADHFLIFNLLVWNEETGSTDHDRCVIDRLKIADCIEKDESCVKYSSTHTRCDVVKHIFLRKKFTLVGVTMIEKSAVILILL